MATQIGISIEDYNYVMKHEIFEQLVQLRRKRFKTLKNKQKNHKTGSLYVWFMKTTTCSVGRIFDGQNLVLRQKTATNLWTVKFSIFFKFESVANWLGMKKNSKIIYLIDYLSEWWEKWKSIRVKFKEHLEATRKQNEEWTEHNFLISCIVILNCVRNIRFNNEALFTSLCHTATIVIHLNDLKSKTWTENYCFARLSCTRLKYSNVSEKSKGMRWILFQLFFYNNLSAEMIGLENDNLSHLY